MKIFKLEDFYIEISLHTYNRKKMNKGLNLELLEAIFQNFLETLQFQYKLKE